MSTESKIEPMEHARLAVDRCARELRTVENRLADLLDDETRRRDEYLDAAEDADQSEDFWLEPQADACDERIIGEIRGEIIIVREAVELLDELAWGKS